MKIYCNQYIGQMMNCTTAFCDLIKDKTEGEKDEIFNKLFKNRPTGRLKELKFRPSSAYKNEPKKGDVEFVYDRMNGDYCFLVHIIDVDRNSVNENMPNKIINRALKDTVVSTDIADRMTAIYKELFGRKGAIPNVHLRQLAHFHKNEAGILPEGLNSSHSRACAAIRQNSKGCIACPVKPYGARVGIA